MSLPYTNESLQTTCTQCHSTFKLNLSQLLAADGKVRCSECHSVFDANIHLVRKPRQDINLLDELASAAETESVSLHEAMHDGNQKKPSKALNNISWAIGIILLVIIAGFQWVYFNRLKLIQSPNTQSLVLTLCSFIPCDKSEFKNTKQFTLIERNIFTHPTQANALLISGSFVNEAPFSQKPPALKISLFNLNSEIIAQRIFSPIDYYQNEQSINSIAPGERIQFKLEVEDPNTITITYEFEFL